mmetsp:Transcript_1923/g.2741  ORF Transcript_1923/g.2741 Transcript_1923/m.2741 type:complete len:191 (-) Transcript_1923:2960-3532(-)
MTKPGMGLDKKQYQSTNFKSDFKASQFDFSSKMRSPTNKAKPKKQEKFTYDSIMNTSAPDVFTPPINIQTGHAMGYVNYVNGVPVEPLSGVTSVKSKTQKKNAKKLTQKMNEHHLPQINQTRQAVKYLDQEDSPVNLEISKRSRNQANTQSNTQEDKAREITQEIQAQYHQKSRHSNLVTQQSQPKRKRI